MSLEQSGNRLQARDDPASEESGRAAEHQIPDSPGTRWREVGDEERCPTVAKESPNDSKLKRRNGQRLVVAGRFLNQGASIELEDIDLERL